MADTHYYKRSANVSRRYVITGKLVLTSPTSLSNGDTGGLTDIAIRRDAASGDPVLPGTSMAGALRDYLWLRLPERGNDGWNQKLVNQLFGENNKADKFSQQSRLFIEDAYGQQAGIELRDGVAIEARTRTAADKKMFDVELLAAGTTFGLCLEFWESAEGDEQPQAQRQLLALALLGLQDGEILLGGRKRRGFGECKVEEWQVHRYDMADKKDIIRWLEADKENPQPGTGLQTMFNLAGLNSLSPLSLCQMQAAFDIDTSLLIRATSDNPKDPDMVHLRNHAGQPVLSGTSLAGALRARAGRILRTLRTDEETAAFINNLFGQEMEDEKKVTPRASRLWLRDTEIKESVSNRVQSRVKIDRFTSGSYPGALFDQQPVFGGEVTLNFTIRQPTQADIGLLMLLLKDLWTGDLPLGGEASVGRGRLRGRYAELNWQGKTWRIQTSENRLDIQGDRDVLETAVQSLSTAPIVEERNP